MYTWRRLPLALIRRVGTEPLVLLLVSGLASTVACSERKPKPEPSPKGLAERRVPTRILPPPPKPQPLPDPCAGVKPTPLPAPVDQAKVPASVSLEDADGDQRTGWIPDEIVMLEAAPRRSRCKRRSIPYRYRGEPSLSWDVQDGVIKVNCRVMGVDLTGLMVLDLDRTAVGNAGLARVAKLKGAALKHIAGLTGLTRLRRLSLHSKNLAGEGLRFLAWMTRLRWLDLSQTGVDDAALHYLARLTGLQYLNLDFTPITGRGTN